MQILEFIKAAASYLFLISIDYLVMIRKFLSGFIFFVGLFTVVLYIASKMGIGQFIFLYGEGWNCVK